MGVCVCLYVVVATTVVVRKMGSIGSGCRNVASFHYCYAAANASPTCAVGLLKRSSFVCVIKLHGYELWPGNPKRLFYSLSLSLPFPYYISLYICRFEKAKRT